MATTEHELNQCPKCQLKTATSEVSGDTSRFYCTSPDCSFELQQQKQDMKKAQKTLESIRASLVKQ